MRPAKVAAIFVGSTLIGLLVGAGLVRVVTPVTGGSTYTATTEDMRSLRALRDRPVGYTQPGEVAQAEIDSEILDLLSERGCWVDPTNHPRPAAVVLRIPIEGGLTTAAVMQDRSTINDALEQSLRGVQHGMDVIAYCPVNR